MNKVRSKSHYDDKIIAHHQYIDGGENSSNFRKETNHVKT